MPSEHERNTEGLIKSREKKSNECRERVDKAIRQLLREKSRINFNSVAERANVSKKYLYDHHCECINDLRSQQEGLDPKHVKREMSDASKDVLIAAKNKRIRELEDEVKKLKVILEHRYGEDYEKNS